MADPSAWQLTGFVECIDQWIADDDPDEAVRHSVLVWVLGRIEDPFPGARREPGFADLWWL